MIKPGEIQLKAREAGVRDQQIEKDYILAWILKGIAEHKHLSNVLVFKGGTVLKKTYFEDYRYSEDLDFTLFNNDITNKQIFGWFKESFNYIREEANIPLSLLDDNEHEDGGIYFYIGYTGPLGGQASNKKVKVDISRTEKLEFDPVVRPAYLTYSDLEAYSLLCYSLEEILVEKMRSIMQRMQARDFYDLWFLLEIQNMDVHFFLNEFRRKCESKGLKSSDFSNKLIERLPQYKGRWNRSLSEQIKDLPGFEQAERETLRSLKKISF
jgi:predicted nucleotidyltransferase component of viral defense system